MTPLDPDQYSVLVTVARPETKWIHIRDRPAPRLTLAAVFRAPAGEHQETEEPESGDGEKGATGHPVLLTRPAVRVKASRK